MNFLRNPLFLLGVISLLIGALICVILAAVKDATPPPANPVNDQQVTKKPTPIECAEHLPNSFLAGQVLMVGVGARDFSVEEPIFKKYQIGGATVMVSPSDPNDGSIKSFKTAASTSGVPILISTDEEGGLVQRFSNLGVLPAPAAIVEQMSPTKAQDLIATHGEKLKEIGVDMVLGPLADVAPTSGKSILGSRVFSSDPQVVASYASSYLKGWQQAGLVATLKHFPGMGSASGNTDFQPATVPTLNLLKERDFLPYEDLNKTDVSVMIGNQNVPGWFTGAASLSKTVNDYLRGDLGYKDNLIVTDSLDAVAIVSSLPLEQAAVASIAAGNDIALVVNPKVGQELSEATVSLVKTTLENAIGITISKKQIAASVVRKLSAQHLNPCTLTFK